MHRVPPEHGQKGSAAGAVNRAGPGKPRAAALVFDDSGTAQGWYQNGSPKELLGIKHRRQYGKDAPQRPDWRITCFAGKKQRGQESACAALDDALD